VPPLSGTASPPTAGAGDPHGPGVTHEVKST